MKRKILIAVWHSGDKGKTESIRASAHALISVRPMYKSLFPIPILIPPIGDFRMVVNVKGSIVAFESQGDPGTKLDLRLKDIESTYNPDVIICSCRTRGETVQAIWSMSPNYEIIYTSTYDTNITAVHSSLNNLKGTHIIDILITMGII